MTNTSVQQLCVSDLVKLVIGWLYSCIAVQRRMESSSAKSSSIIRGIHGLKESYDLVIVGAGLSGSVIAEQVRGREQEQEQEQGQ